jgi:glucosamine--fructose-6-phosphate aminotransferase (isomerizing)
VICIVNRRNSDLVEKSDGVLYTSDGRDVEMSVASTKAFFSQLAAGFLLAEAIAEHLGCGDRRRADRLMRDLTALPAAMDELLAQRSAIADIARRLAPRRRNWAVVGNGRNRIAASEIRIKLSELCYMAIATDATEDKKHIDLSSEPLVMVCAAGLSGSTADDVAKEVAIYLAHKAAPVVVASREQAGRFADLTDTIEVPDVGPETAFLLSAMVGQLFGYEAALAIDAQAQPLREARAVIQAELPRRNGEELMLSVRPALERSASRFFERLRAGGYNGHLEADTAVRVASMLRYASGAQSIEGYELEYGKIGMPDAIVVDLVDALTAAIDQLTRPIDAIKHQAKTVTVGISRSEDKLFAVRLVAEALSSGAPPDGFPYRTLRMLADLDPAVEEVRGFTRYQIHGDVRDGATISVVNRGGISIGLSSRTDHDPRLLGTKHRVAQQREVVVARGARDGRGLVLVPEFVGSRVSAITLLHAGFRDRLAPEATRQLLSRYGNRFGALVDAVTETEPQFDEELLDTIPLVELLTEPVDVIAGRWRRRGANEQDRPVPIASGRG